MCMMPAYLYAWWHHDLMQNHDVHTSIYMYIHLKHLDTSGHPDISEYISEYISIHPSRQTDRQTLSVCQTDRSVCQTDRHCQTDRQTAILTDNNDLLLAWGAACTDWGTNNLSMNSPHQSTCDENEVGTYCITDSHSNEPTFLPFTRGALPTFIALTGSSARVTPAFVVALVGWAYTY